MQINRYIDHTLLKPTATPQDIIELCQEAREHNFYAVCVNGCYVSLAKEELKNSKVKLAAVIGFPLGAMDTDSKIAEAKNCIKNGADEVDMVINIGRLKARDYTFVEQEVSEVKKAIENGVLKVIIETCYLTTEEKKIACECAMKARADFVKTSTGFGTGGATPEDVALMRSVVGEKLQIKASGGIRDAGTAKNYIKLGVDRIGTSSGVSIVTLNN